MYTQQAAASQAEIFKMSYGNTGWTLKFLKVKSALQQPAATVDTNCTYRCHWGLVFQTDVGGKYECTWTEGRSFIQLWTINTQFDVLVLNRSCNSYNWGASIGGSSSGSTHLWCNKSRINAWAGERAVHLMMTHHSKRGIGTRHWQRSAQCRGS